MIKDNSTMGINSCGPILVKYLNSSNRKDFAKSDIIGIEFLKECPLEDHEEDKP